jgi:site-specific DNA recombinase
VRCAIYTRKSTEEGLDQEFNSLDAQREAAEAYIRSQAGQGWILLPERYDDGGFTGGNMERPGLRHLLADIEDGQIDCVVVYKVDRLSRSLLDFSRLMEIFERHNVSFVSVTQQFNTATSMGRLVLNVLLSFAQFEREIIGERIRDKMAATRRRGKWTGGTPILGYDLDRSQGRPRLVINAEEAARVREIFRLYRSLGSLLPVVQELNRRGWQNKAWKGRRGRIKGGRPFGKSSLHALLTNPLYIGKIRYRGALYQGEHEAIVDAEVFEQVQAMLRHNRQVGNVTNRNKYGALLRGLLFCKACGRAMTHTFTCKGQRQYRYYTCTRAIQNGHKVCPSGSLPAGEIERVVIDEIRAIANDRGLQAEVLRQVQEHFAAERAELTTEERQLKRELSRYDAELRRLSASHGAAEQLAELHDRMAQGERRLGEIRQRLQEQEQNSLTAADIDAALADFDGVWDSLSTREQVQLVALLVARVEFDAVESTVAISFHPTALKALADKQHGGTP